MMYFLQVFFLLLLAIIVSVYYLHKYSKLYWQKRNVPVEAEALRLVQNKKHFAYVIQDIYMKWKHCGNPLVGIYLWFSPFVLVLDLDLIKSIFIGDFESFPDRGFYHNLIDDPLSGNLFRLEGEAWKRLRAKFTPTFTSGKMKFMFPTVVAVAERFVTLLEEQLSLPARYNELEMRDLCARFTTDVIGSVAFGLECNTLRDPHSEFRVVGDKALACFNPYIETLGAKYPRIFNLLRIRAFPKELNEFYARIVRQNVEYRERNNIRRNDFMDILIELKNNGDDLKLSIEEIIAQAFVFFIGGFETSSTTMSYCLYELSKNQDIQNKARDDVRNNLIKHNGVLTYECLKDMHYLEQVLLETLRLYPVGPVLKRVAAKNYKVPNTTYFIDKGTIVLIPVYAIHNDLEIFPNPSAFDPERFSSAEVQKRHQMSFLPFGAGPRVCIAERFGKMQTLIGLAKLLRNFKFTPSTKTPKFLDFNPKNKRTFSIVGGMHLNVETVA